MGKRELRWSICTFVLFILFLAVGVVGFFVELGTKLLYLAVGLIFLTVITAVITVFARKKDMNEKVIELLGKYGAFVKKELFKIEAVPEVVGRMKFLNLIYGDDEGRKFVLISLKLKKGSYDKEMVFWALEELAKEDYSDIWRDVDIICKDIDYKASSKHERSDLVNYILTIEIPKDACPPVKPPCNGYKHILLGTISQIIPVERV